MTTIVGPSDAGKSALIRALAWVLTNRPKGDAFIRDGSDRVEVYVKVDGHKLKRRRGKKNTYHLDGAVFTAFGVDVPDTIAQLVNVSDLNFQGQHDSTGFWFSLSPGEVSRRLNRVVDLGTIDSTLGNLASLLRSTRAEERVVQTRLTEAREEQTKLRTVKKVDRALCSIEALQTDLTSSTDRSAFLNVLLEKGLRHATQAERARNVLLRGRFVVEIGDELESTRSRRMDLQILLGHVEDCESTRWVTWPDLTSIEKIVEELESHWEQINNLWVLLNQHAEESENYERLHTELHDLHDEMNTLFGDVCPLCQQPILSSP